MWSRTTNLRDRRPAFHLRCEPPRRHVTRPNVLSYLQNIEQDIIFVCRRVFSVHSNEDYGSLLCYIMVLVPRKRPSLGHGVKPWEL